MHGGRGFFVTCSLCLDGAGPEVSVLEVTMANMRTGGGGLVEFAITKARAMLRDRDPDGALRWLETVPTDARPKALESEIRHSAARLAASKG